MRTPPYTGNVSTTTPRLDRLVLDPAMQCRLEVNDDVVDEYAEAMLEGRTFPPIRFCIVDGKRLVVDGWHRVHAARAAGLERIAAEHVATCTRREAMLEAVKANREHGLRRSSDDKRRAVRVLLTDPEWSAMSNRELAELAGVSHAFVGKVRRHFGVQRGELLTDERIEEVDGDLPPVWAALEAKLPGYGAQDLRSIRQARTALKVLSSAVYNGHDAITEARQLRLQELAVHDDWPWEEDTSKARRRARAKVIDSAADIECALASRLCPDELRLKLAKALRAAKKRPTSLYEIPGLLETVKGRPRLVARLEEKRAELQAQAAAEPWTVARKLASEEDLNRYAAGLRDATADVLQELVRQRTGPEHAARLRPIVEAREIGEVHDCPDARCGGWYVQRNNRLHCCVLCGQNPAAWVRWHDDVEERLPELLQAGDRFRVGEVDLDQAGVDLLASLRSFARSDAEGFAELLRWLQPGARSDLALGLTEWLGEDSPPLAAWLTDTDTDREAVHA